MALPVGNCNQYIIPVDNSCGCTLTRANITAFTEELFQAQGYQEVGMARIMANAREAARAGVQERALANLFLSRTVPMKTVSLTQDRSIISPFILVPQRSAVNANWFVVSAGSATPGAGAGGIPASAWDVTVINESSQFASPLVNLERYFLPGHFVNVSYRDQANNAGRTVQFQVYASVHHAPIGVVQACTLTLIPPYTAAGWAVVVAAGNAPIFQPTHGVLVTLDNSVSNFESWCYNHASDNPLKFLEYWWQTRRRTFCYNDEYLKALTAPLTSEWFRKFQTLPLAQQRAQQEEKAQAEHFWTIMMGQAINEMQTQATYQSLPQVVDPANPSCLLEYKSNTLGYRTQLQNCGRVIDNQNAPLNLDTLKSLLYSLRRNRQANGGMGSGQPRIDAMGDRIQGDNLLTIMIQYYQHKYGMQYTRFFKAGEAITFEGQVLWNYNVYDFPDEGLQLAYIQDDFFDDQLAVYQAANGGIDSSRGRSLWLIDWSDAKVALGGTASATRQTNTADNLYNCVIQPNVNHYQLMSETFAAMIELPNRHLIIENISSACPTITATPCSVNS